MATIRSIINGFLGLKKDPNATTQDVAVIKVEDTDAGLVLNPNGTGAIMAQVPDGTATGGNARGQYAVDLQMIRGINTQIAGNRAVIVGGSSNTASGTQSVVVGGQNNIADKLQSFIGGGNGNTIAGGLGENAIVGGTLNTNSGTYGFIGAGFQNTVSSNYSTVSGGQSNTASTNTHATVVGGQSNTASGQHSVAGGNGNTASGRSSVALGRSNTASASESYAFGDSNNTSSSGGVTIGGSNTTSGGIRNYAFGQGNSVSSSGTNNIAIGSSNIINSGSYNIVLAIGTDHQGASYSTSIGINPSAYLRNQFVHSAVGGFPIRGRSQVSNLIAYNDGILSSGGTVTLSLDGTGTGNLIIPLNNNRAWNVTVEYVAVCTAAGSGTTVVGDVVTGTDKFRFKRVSGTSTIGAVTNIELTQDASMTSAECQYSVGGSNDLQVEFVAPTTANATTFRVVAKVSLVEVAW